MGRNPDIDEMFRKMEERLERETKKVNLFDLDAFLAETERKRREVFQNAKDTMKRHSTVKIIPKRSPLKLLALCFIFMFLVAVALASFGVVISHKTTPEMESTTPKIEQPIHSEPMNTL